DRHRPREDADVDPKKWARPEPVGEPRPKINPGDAKHRGDLTAGAELGNGDREILHDERHDQSEDHAVHAVEAPAGAVRNRDVPVRPRHFAVGAGDVSVIWVLHVLLFERPGAARGGSADAHVGVDRRRTHRVSPALRRTQAALLILVVCRMTRPRPRRAPDLQLGSTKVVPQGAWSYGGHAMRGGGACMQ